MTRQNAASGCSWRRRGRIGIGAARFLQAIGRFGPGTLAGRLGRPGRHELVCRAGSQRGPSGLARSGARRPAGENEQKAARHRPQRQARTASPPDPRPPALVLPLAVHGKARAQIHLWTRRRERGSSRPAWPARRPIGPGNRGRPWSPIGPCWNAGSRRSSSRVRQQIDREDDRLQALKLEALAEFAGGAGHELNNPAGGDRRPVRSSCSARTDDPETVRSLRIILSQAGRAHRILRDLMFVARPPAPRPRPCRPADLLCACLRDLQEECTARGIRLVSEIDESAARRARSIPTRCAISPRSCFATRSRQRPPAARSSSGRACKATSFPGLSPTQGKGISPADAAHLFDPFYCGRQAGRGLGLGLPRAARLVAQAGGRLHWSSNPGHGAVFQVHLPLSPPGVKEKRKQLAPLSARCVECNRPPAWSTAPAPKPLCSRTVPTSRL